MSLLLLAGCVALGKSPRFPGSQLGNMGPTFLVSVATDWREPRVPGPLLRAGLQGDIRPAGRSARVARSACPAVT